MKGNVFAVGLLSGNVMVYNAANPNKEENIMTLSGHYSSCSMGKFSYDGKMLVTISHDKSTKVWDLKTKSCKNTIKGSKYHKGEIICLALSTSKSLCVTGSDNEELGIANYELGTVLHMQVTKNNDSSNSIENIAFANDDNYIVYSTSEFKLIILELQKLTIRSIIDLKEENVSKLIPSKKNSYLLYFGTTFGKFCVLDSRGKSEIIITEQLHSMAIMDFCYNLDETHILTSSIDKTINLMKIDSIDYEA